MEFMSVLIPQNDETVSHRDNIQKICPEEQESFCSMKDKPLLPQRSL